MNLYFLFIACLQLWSYITPVDPLSTWGPLMVIFAISAIKEGVDDYNRYLSDKKANERLYTVLRSGKREKVDSPFHPIFISLRSKVKK
jgi:phospholipid-translocating ATPase